MTVNPPTAEWFKSSKSPQGSECFEARFDADRVGIRDSKDHGRGPELWFTPAQWDTFLRSNIWNR
ncbi:DUF397 domain-containing protein [Nocardia inohanensis]|uniref:DUF397 domain-containing protein n=1 Tax=Nocardia inohanensis TaxID=209246 RepID=UPI0008335E65|nr:DUF397 domain-containing protein [Nocardia inohanensis]